MPVDLEDRFRDAVQYIWTGRLQQREKQAEAGKSDAGSRGDVTGGGHMGAIELLVKDLLIEFGDFSLNITADLTSHRFRGALASSMTEHLRLYDWK